MGLNLARRNESFFPLFSQQSDILLDASRLLVKEAAFCDRNAHLLAGEVLDLEHRGDRLIREIAARVHTCTVSTPEPEEVRLLSGRLDDVLDGIEEVAHRIAAYRLLELPEKAVRLCQIIENCVSLIRQAFEPADGSGCVPAQYTGIAQLEKEADALVRAGVAELLQQRVDAVLVVKLKEIYELLESTVDCCKDVADVLEDIASKNV